MANNLDLIFGEGSAAKKSDNKTTNKTKLPKNNLDLILSKHKEQKQKQAKAKSVLSQPISLRDLQNRLSIPEFTNVQPQQNQQRLINQIPAFMHNTTQTPEQVIDSMRDKYTSYGIKQYIDSIPNLSEDYKLKLYKYGNVPIENNLKLYRPETNEFIENSTVWDTRSGQRIQTQLRGLLSAPGSAVNQAIINKVQGSDKDVGESLFEGFEKGMQGNFVSITDLFPEGYQQFKEKHPWLSMPVEIVANIPTDPVAYIPLGAIGKGIPSQLVKKILSTGEKVGNRIRIRIKDLKNIIDEDIFKDGDIFEGLGDIAAQAPTRSQIKRELGVGFKQQPAVETPKVIELGGEVPKPRTNIKSMPNKKKLKNIETWGPNNEYSNAVVSVVRNNEGKVRFDILDDGTPVLYAPDYMIRDEDYIKTKLFRYIDEYLSPLEEDVFIRVSNNKDDYFHLVNKTHRGSKNHATGEFEGGLSVSKRPEFPAKYAYYVKGKKIGQGTDGEPLLETSSVVPVSKQTTYRQLERDYEKKLDKKLADLGLDRNDLKLLRTARLNTKNILEPTPQTIVEKKIKTPSVVSPLAKNEITPTAETKIGLAKTKAVQVDEFKKVIDNPKATKAEIETAISKMDEYKASLKSKLDELSKKKATPAVQKQIDDITNKLFDIDLQLFAAKKRVGQRIPAATKRRIENMKKAYQEKIRLQKVKDAQKIYELEQKYKKKINDIKYVDMYKRLLKEQEANAKIKNVRATEKLKYYELKDKMETMKQEFREKIKATKELEKKRKIREDYKKLWKELLAKKEAAEQAEKRNMLNSLKKIDLKHMRPEYKKAVEDILSNYDLGAMKRTNKKLDRLNKLKQFLEENEGNLIPDKKLKELEILSKKSFSELTVEEMRDIHNAVMHLVALEKLKNKLIFGKVYKDFKEARDEAVSNVLSNKTAKDIDPDNLDTTLREPMAGWFKQHNVASMNPETISISLDNKRQGIIKKVFYDGPDEGISNMYKYQDEAKDLFKTELENINLKGWSELFHTKKKDVEYEVINLSSNRKIKLTKAERISLILHSKNKGNLRHLLQGGFSFSGNKGTIYKLSKEELDIIINSSTKEEKKVADAVFKYFNDFQKKRLNEVSVELNGWEIATEKNYFPIKVNPITIKRNALKPKESSFTESTLEGMGIFKERTNAKNPLLVEDVFKVVYENLQKTSAYYGLAKPLRNAKMLLYDQEFRIALGKVNKNLYWEELEKYVKDLETNALNLDFIDKLTADLINKADTAILALNPWIIAKQPSSYILASNEIDAKYLKAALRMKSNLDEVRKYSPQLKRRIEGAISIEMGELGRVGAVREFFTDKKSWGQKFTAGITKVDAWTVGKVWNAVKLETKELYPKLEGNEFYQRVAKRTEEIIRHTNSVSEIHNRSGIGRTRNMFARAFTRFTSQTNVMYNSLIRHVLEYNMSSKSAKDKARLLFRIFNTVVVSSLFVAQVDNIRDKLYGREKDKDVNYVYKNALSVLRNAFGLTYIGNLIASPTISALERDRPTAYNLSNPALQFAENGIRAGFNAYKAILQAISNERYKSGDKKGEKKWKTSALKALDEAASFISKLKGLPYDNIKKIIEGGYKNLTD